MRRIRRVATETELEATPNPTKPEQTASPVNGDASKIEQDRLAKMDFFDLLQQQEAEEWRHRKLYIYRVWPRIERADDSHYLTALTQPVDPEYVKQTFGSGRYLLLLRDSLSKKAIAQHTFTVHDIDYPPKLNPREILECDENRRYYEIWPASGGKETATAKPAANGDGAATVAVRELGELARQASDKGLDENLMKLYMDATKARDDLAQKLATSAKPDNGATDQLAMLDRVLGLVERLKADSKPSESQPADAKMDALDALDRAADLINKLRPPALLRSDAPQPNGISQVKEMVELVGALKETFGGAAESAPVEERGWLGEVIRSSARLLERPLTLLTQVLVARMIPTPPSLSEQPAPTPTPGINSPPTEKPGNGLSPQQQMMNEIAPTLIAHLRDSQLDGHDFADWFINGIPGTTTGGYGPRFHNEVVAMGRDALLSGVKTFPAIWQQIEPLGEQRITTFLDEFLKGPMYEDEPPAPAQGNPAGRRKTARKE